MIRFKTLKNSTEKHRAEAIEKNWAEIFHLSGHLSELGFFKNTDVFLERFINSISISGDGEKDDKSRIKCFEKNYSSDYGKGVADLLSVLRSWYLIFDYESGIIKNFKDVEKYKSFIHLLSLTLKINTNSQFAFISYLKNIFNSELFMSDKKFQGGFAFEVFQIIKATFSLTVFHNIRSNTTRRIFIEIARSFSSKNKDAIRLWYKNFTNEKISESTLGFESSFFPSEDYKVKASHSGIKTLFIQRAQRVKRLNIFCLFITLCWAGPFLKRPI